jgi:ubiquinone/menaquinone biosynthesis C-methylase UbiE
MKGLMMRPNIAGGGSLRVPGSIDYNQAAPAYARYRDVQSGVLQALVELGVDASSRVLEVGCGTANHARALRAETGCAVWGVDPSVGMLQQAARRGGRGAVRLSAGRGEALPYADRSFDLLFSVDVVHHIRDLDVAFAEMARLLRPGGLLLTATDSEATIRARPVLSGYFPETVPHELARYPSTARLEVAHARSDLEILERFIVEHPYVIEDARPFRERAYSCLHLISDEALAAGVTRLETDVPLVAVSRNYVVVGRVRDRA